MAGDRAVVIGAGVGGLSAAALLAARGHAVTLLEKEAAPGGKMRLINAGGGAIDGGPTVFTMKPVFEALFEACGARLEDHVGLEPCHVLARHAWADGARLDLFAEHGASEEAIAAFAGSKEVQGFRAFAAEAATLHALLRETMLEAQRPSVLSLPARIGWDRPDRLLALRPFETLWSALGRHFESPRLRQLFGRYATYCGCSPFQAPATLALIAHVELEGVWLVRGGMHALAQGLARLAQAKGAHLRYGAAAAEIIVSGGRASGVRLADGEEIHADIVVANADSHALASGLLGAAARKAAGPTPQSARSLSAVTWAGTLETEGFPLARHTVFFSDAYKAEFDAIFGRGRLPETPTLYLCAQDRDDAGAGPAGPERLLLLANAPATGADLSDQEIDACQARALSHLEACGLRLALDPARTVRTGPAQWEALFPGTRGAIYGRAMHGPFAPFQRMGARSRLPGLYLTGGSVHPGAGVPMAALSGRLAAEAILADRASTPRFRPAAIAGGMSTRSATTGSMA